MIGGDVMRRQIIHVCFISNINALARLHPGGHPFKPTSCCIAAQNPFRLPQQYQRRSASPIGGPLAPRILPIYRWLPVE
jgi:hypothetical protein